MSKYDSYKDSGVDWMNEIPSSWEKSRIRMVGDLYGGLTGKKGNDFNNEDNPSNKPFVPFTNIFNNTYISKDHFQYVNVEENENQNRVLKNDLFFLMSSESYEDLGKCSILLDDVEELYLNSFCKGFRIKDSKVYPLFLNYQLLGSLHKEMISVEGNGFTRINLRQDRLLDIPVFIPPLYEQQQIVSFLDTKTSLIDSLIEKTQRKIELLKEKRTSLINEVVTKGLNPNVEMKDSGVEWIGEIPSNWGCFEFKFVINLLTDFESNGSFKSVKENVKVLDDIGPVWYVRMTDLENNNIRNDKCKYCDFDTYEFLHKTKLDGGELLITKRGEIGKVYIFPNDSGISTLGPNSYLLKLDESEVSPNFLFYFYKSDFGQITLKLMDKSTTIGSIYKDDLKNSKVIIPPLSEQQQIVDYLDEYTQRIDKTISIEEKRIELLKEYRQSLISEVVTGKRKVVE